MKIKELEKIGQDARKGGPGAWCSQMIAHFQPLLEVAKAADTLAYFVRHFDMECAAEDVSMGCWEELVQAQLDFDAALKALEETK